MILRYISFLYMFGILPHLQAIDKFYDPQALDGNRYHELLEMFGNNKSLLKGYESQVLIALSHYPELKDTRIKFRFINKGTPLTARPTVLSTIFRSAKKRTYLITVAKDTDPRWSPILLHHLPYNAQIGVFGHEIAHVADFSRRSFWGMLQVLFGNLSKSFMDGLEYNADLITIQHGLGHQLLAWSTYVRQVLQFQTEAAPVTKEINSEERYMSPGTIRRYMEEEEIYLGE